MIHLTSEGKKYILENMLLPKKEILHRVYVPLDPIKPIPTSRQANFTDLQALCNTLESINGWKITYRIHIGTSDGTLLAILINAGVDPCLLLELESSINWKIS